MDRVEAPTCVPFYGGIHGRGLDLESEINKTRFWDVVFQPPNNHLMHMSFLRQLR